MTASALRRALGGALCLAVVAAAVLVADVRLERTFRLRIDGQEVEITTGQELAVACAHADGKTHAITVAESPLQRFARKGLRFTYPSACTVTFDEAGEELSVSVRHPEGPDLKVHRMASEVDLRDSLVRHAATLVTMLKTGGGSQIEESEVSAAIAGAAVPGRQISCLLLGEARVTEIYYFARAGRSIRVSLDYGVEQAKQAQELFDAVAPTLALE